MIKCKNILFLTSTFPYPPDSGGKRGSLSDINILSKKYRLYLFYIGEQDQNEEVLYRKYQIKKIYNFRKNTENNILELIKNTFSRTPCPYTCQKYHSREAYRKIEDIIKREKIDAAFIDHLHMAFYGLLIRNNFPHLKIILREHNVEHILWQRSCRAAKNFFKKIITYLQAKKILRYEARVAPFFDLCLMVSSLDEERIKEISVSSRTAVVPPAVDVPDDVRDKENKNLHGIVHGVIPKSLIFTGNFLWLPNKKGALWFLNNVWSDIKKEFPEAKFFIVGKNPSKEILAYKDKDVIITGYVEDIRPWLEQAEISIVPIFFGGGVRIKILEAMAMGKPIISTSLGAEGIGVFHGKEIFIADNKKEFIEGIKLLFGDEGVRQKLSKNAKDLIKSKYTFLNLAQKLYKAIDSLR